MKPALNFYIILACFIHASLSAQVKPQSFVYNKPAQSVGVSGERLVYIDRLLQEYVDKGIIPQALTFVAKNGVVVHNKAFGWSDMQEVKIPLPDIGVQQSIVDIYDSYITRRDINEKLKAQIKNLCPILIKGSIEEANA